MYDIDRVNRFLLAIIILALLALSCNLLSQTAPAAVTATSPILPQVVATLQASPFPTVTRQEATAIPAPTATATQAPPAATVDIPGDWLRYTDSDYGIALSYPPEGELLLEQPANARINLPYSSGTNLQEKYLEINLLRAGGECASPIASGYDPAAIQSETVDVNGIEFERQSGGEGAAGNYYIWQAFRTQRGDVCVSLTFVLHSTNAMFHDPPLAEYDEPAEAAVFQEILETFAWLP